MDTISSNISQVASVRTVTSLNYIKRTYNLPVDNNNSFEKKITEEAKNSIVSEQQDDNFTPASFNYQFQHNVPISLLSTAGQTFNETAKPLVSKSSPTSNDKAENSDYSVEETNEDGQQNVSGYYIIDKNAAVSSSKLQKTPSPMQARLNKTYNLNFGIEPGTIVNITCY
jgi:hypothetical protein